VTLFGCGRPYFRDPPQGGRWRYNKAAAWERTKKAWRSIFYSPPRQTNNDYLSFRLTTPVSKLDNLKEKAVWLFTRGLPSISSTQLSLCWNDTERSVLWGLSPECNLRSKIRWFTEFCNSHYVSHFAAFFIDRKTEISVAKSCINVLFTWVR